MAGPEKAFFLRSEGLEVDDEVFEESDQNTRRERRRAIGQKIIRDFLPFDDPGRLKSASELIREVLAKIPPEKLSEVTLDLHLVHDRELAPKDIEDKKRNAWLKDKAGLSIDTQDRVRLQVPGRPDLAGSYFDSQVLKGLILGFKKAGTDLEKQWKVAAAACEYLGVQAPPRPEVEDAQEVQRSGGLLRWLQKKGTKTAGILTLLALFEARPLLDAEAKAFAAPDEDTRAAVSERAQEHADIYAFKQGDNPTRVVHDLFVQRKGRAPGSEEFKKLMQDFCAANSISSPGWGVLEGKNDEHNLPIGFPADISNTIDLIEKM